LKVIRVTSEIQESKIAAPDFLATWLLHGGFERKTTKAIAHIRDCSIIKRENKRIPNQQP
jgi:hypothetical protein